MKRFAIFSTVVVALILLAFLVPAPAQGTAALGDPAKPLTISQWFKGEPAQIEKGKVYVIEFWATWCPPCRTSIPHLTELQKKFPEVILIGITDEPEEKVMPFIEDMGDKMDYRVARDGEEEETSRDYMAAYGKTGIPCAFIVDAESRVVWVGHPMSGDFESTLEAVQAGSFDFSAAKAAQEEERDISGQLDELQKKLGALLEAPPAKPLDMAALGALMDEMGDVLLDYLRSSGQLGGEVEEAEVRASIKDNMSSSVLAMLVMGYLEAATDEEAGFTAAIQQVLADKDFLSACTLNSLTYALLTDEDIPAAKRNVIGLLLAESVNARLDEAPDSEDQGAHMDTYAYALHLNGRTAEALVVQERAVALYPDEPEGLEHLELYRSTLQPAADEPTESEAETE